MATSYPGGLDAFTNPAPSDDIENANPALDHDLQHANANDAIEAIQAKVGIDSSAVTTSHDYIIQRYIPKLPRTLVDPAAVSILTMPGVGWVNSGNTAFTFDRDYYLPLICECTVTFDRVYCEIAAASGSGGSVARAGIYNADASWQPTGTLIEDFGTVASDSTGIKTWTPASGSRTLAPGRYVLAFNTSAANTTYRTSRGHVVAMTPAAMGNAATLVKDLYVARTNAAFPSTGTTWTNVSGSTVPIEYPLYLRVTTVAVP
jgi:hypothetical protein